MKRIKWLIELADTKPILFSIALLLISVTVLAIVVKERDSRVEELLLDQKIIQANCDRKLDSIRHYYMVKEQALNEEVRQLLNVMIENYKNQIESQKQLNERVEKTLRNNKKILN